MYHGRHENGTLTLSLSHIPETPDKMLGELHYRSNMKVPTTRVLLVYDKFAFTPFKLLKASAKSIVFELI